MTKRNSTTVADVINNTAGNVTIIADVTDSVTGENVPNGPVVAKLNGTVIGEGIVENGTAIIPTNLDKIGNYTIELEYLGNENYTESNNTVPVDVVGRPSEITAEPGNETLGNSTVNITLVDPETNEPIPNAPVIITLPDGTNITATTDENGTVEVPVDLPVGPHTLNVTYPGNETYSPSNTTVDLTINPRPSDIEAEVVNNTPGNVTITANVTYAETGLPVPNGPVEVYVNGTLVGTGEVVDGKVTIVTDITEPGSYDFDVRYLGNENYTSSDDDVPADVVSRETEISGDVINNIIGDTEIEITLKDPVTGDLLANKEVIVTLPDGTNVTAVTGDDGKVRLPLDLPAGPNDLVLTFAGDDEYEASTSPMVVDVVKRNATLTPEVVNRTPGKAVIEITAIDDLTGKPVVNGTIELTLADGTKVRAVTDENGVARFENVTVPKGGYNYDAKLLENPIYNEADTNGTVKPIKIKITIKIGDWKLVCVVDEPENGDIDYKDVINRHVPKYKAQKAVRANRASRYSTPGKYRKYSPRKYRPAWNRGRPHFVPTHRLSKAKYQLYIYLSLNTSTVN
ncbi:MAG: hypothetical protein E7Z85_05515 [Methanosphaera stadtmanae]|nr:hypothetical protein [Methanosphaera stadtmanae]